MAKKRIINNIGKVGMTLALALLPHYSCSKEPTTNGSIMASSQEELTPQYFQEHYNVVLMPGFNKETLSMFDEVLNKVKSKYGNFFDDTEVHIRPLSDFESSFTHHNVAAYSQARETQFTPKANELLLKMGYNQKEIKELKNKGLIKGTEEYTVFNKKFETLTQEEKEDLRKTIGDVSLAENSLLVYPTNSVPSEGASWIFAHELGHILTGREKETLTRVKEEFNRIKPYGIEEAIFGLPNPRKTSFSNIVTTMVEHMEKVKNAAAHNGKILPEFNSYYPLSIHSGLITVQGLDIYADHYAKLGEKDKVDALENAKKAVIADLGNQPTERDLLVEDSAEIFAQTIIGPEFKTKITQKKGRALEEILEEEYSD